MRRLALLFLLAACSGEGASDADAPRAVPTARPRAVLVVAVDGLRLDDVASFERCAPHLASLRARAVRPLELIAPAPGLNACLAGWLTGEPPWQLGIGSLRLRGGTALADAHTTAAEVYAAAGWHTVAVMAQPQLRSEITAFDQGFSVYEAPPIAHASRYDAEQGALLLTPHLLGAEGTDAAPVFAFWSVGDLTDEGGQATREAIPALGHHLAPFLAELPRVRAALESGDDDPAATVAEIGRVLGRARGSQAYLAMRRGLREGRLAYVDRCVGELLGALPPEAMVVFGSPRGGVVAPPRDGGGAAFDPELVRVPFWAALPGDAGRDTGAVLGVGDVADVIQGPSRGGSWEPVLAALGRDGAHQVSDGRWERYAGFSRDGHVERPAQFELRAFDRGGAVLEPDEVAWVSAATQALETGRRLSSLRLLPGTEVGTTRLRYVFADGFANVHYPRPDGSFDDQRGTTGALEAGTNGPVELACRRPAQPLRLDLEAEGLSAAQVDTGDTTLERVLVPRLPHPGARDPRPEGARVSFIEDQGWHQLRVRAEPDQTVEVIALRHPARRREDVAIQTTGGFGHQVEVVLGRDDALRTTGVGPLELRLKDTPSREWALAVAIDGVVVPAHAIDAGDAAWGRAGTISLSIPDWLPGVTDRMGPPRELPEGASIPRAADRWQLWRIDPLAAQGPGRGLDPATRDYLSRLPGTE